MSLTVDIQPLFPSHPLLCSVLTPTRNGPQVLTRMVERFFSSLTYPHKSELLIRADEDDHDTLDALPFLRKFGRVNWVIGPRYNGYLSMGAFIDEISQYSLGAWNLLIDDDAWIPTKGWDSELQLVIPYLKAAQMEYYHLDESEYRSHEINTPVGLIVPRQFWKTLGHQNCQQPVDSFWFALLKQYHWRIHALSGMIYKHERGGDWIERQKVREEIAKNT